MAYLWIGKIKGIDSVGRNVGRTDIIPTDDQSRIFNYCESIVSEAKTELTESGIGYHPYDEKCLSESGMRCFTLFLLLVECVTVKQLELKLVNGVERLRREYYFVGCQQLNTKTGKGQVEYLVPELTLNALDILARYSITIRERA
ncbi:hypothetical protein [Providencia rettgeri]|uniref:hypothetical protein n=1 Tax=Providencia rettgeri TaxID=587 RepID=UPI0030103004